jgi:hypothetical protein
MSSSSRYERSPGAERDWEAVSVPEKKVPSNELVATAEAAAHELIWEKRMADTTPEAARKAQGWRFGQVC